MADPIGMPRMPSVIIALKRCVIHQQVGALAEDNGVRRIECFNKLRSGNCLEPLRLTVLWTCASDKSGL